MPSLQFSYFQGLIPSHQALSFVDNHDNQRNGLGGDDFPLTHKEERPYKLATAFNLAHEYGLKRVMSSYYFDDYVNEKAGMF